MLSAKEEIFRNNWAIFKNLFFFYMPEIISTYFMELYKHYS